MAEPGRRAPSVFLADGSAFRDRSPAGLFDRLASSREGLSADEAATRLRRFGVNVLPGPARRSRLAILFAQFTSPLILILLVAAAAAVVAGDPADAGFILAVVLVNAAIGFVQEFRAESDVAALRSLIPPRVRVRRAGVVVVADAAAIVPGDVVLVEAGERVPADLRLFASADLAIDESALTGESLPAEKLVSSDGAADAPLSERVGMAHAGTTVIRGRAEGLVVATGPSTEMGRIAGALKSRPVRPPLVVKLERFTRGLGILSLAVVAVFVAVRLGDAAPLQDTLALAVALAVSIVPEGLPIAVTVALALAARRMAARNVIVRSLPAVEGLGTCTVIATDKTGTLTMNRLTAKRVWLPGRGSVAVAGEGLAVAGGSNEDLCDVAGHEILSLARSGVLCNDASLDPTPGREQARGDTVDVALLVLAAKAGLDFEGLRNAARRTAELPFAAERRFAATITAEEGSHHLHVKGAAEVVLPFCREEHPERVLAVADEMARDGLRVIALAGKPVAAPPRVIPEALSDLRLYGLVGFMDPPRPEARDAIRRCEEAGVDVRMITGDHPVTALAVARMLGLADSAEKVVTGADLEAGSDRERCAAAKVYARVEPLQKVKVVNLLRSRGHVVAMTGDGVNDAPALRAADLGVAMGRDGTDAAREAADLILADDHFASIVSGVEEGRVAYSNIRKVVYLLSSTGLAEIVLFFGAMIAGLPVPLLAAQLLWLNLVTNGGQDVAMAFEKGGDVLRRPPRRPDEPLLDRLMIRQIMVSGTFGGVAGLILFGWMIRSGASEAEARNVLLFFMVAFENVHVFNCRSERRSAFAVPLSANFPLLMAVAAAQTVHIGAAYVPGLSDVLHVAPLSFGTWALTAGAASTVLLVMEIDKIMRGRRGGP
jgi:Ca2+-transporting ATPase